VPFHPLPSSLRRRALAALLGFMAFAFWAALQPALEPPGAYGADKLIHAGTFAFLAYLGVAASPTRRSAILWAFSLVALGAGIEVAQSFIGREASFADLTGDCIGIAAGFTAALLTLGQIARRLLATT